MNILITNDDGINAPGIISLAKEVSKEHNVIIVAPREQKSASSHSISIHNPIKIKEESIEGLDCKAYSVLGTPADCTQIGLSFLQDDIDIVISGINKGPNLGIDILYSGTVSAAVEGAIYGVPSIAVSMDVNYEKDDEDYSKAVKWLMKVLNVAKEKYLKSDVVLNVNIPDLNDNDIKGIKVCKIGKATYNNEYVLVESNDEDKSYKLKGTRNNIEEDETDLYYLSKGYVTLTPLHFDFTNFSILEDVKKIFE
ncbi:5'/3'-nucleotidase SurE [Clostridium saccharobutylicum]|uniref:5'-nucleotidase SurE n=1 Tax=Clostridium saccharobutylicum DSM 13864 TaxID=1345695 RepID=U5MS79_CLOSA|nr:5'/3'-nucleotidase SurE [Clostridium saccharobutylicum]AGX43440.1 5'-nucleotidase SurE [Clostridium saccharobutylicum DSM 13864]AQR90738.1 5'-nucleotidase SurE [Clostridium saccharobutylicum]AQS00642.1 5'-nucleotidase SurE [Clostridium saccharobutylicum]AQS14625.1 5'-nucleotidase SurE [Clostridium saccharobutylicum]MBA2907240.1 5'-nucleotidase [Clostridium saccharobutylicum]